MRRSGALGPLALVLALAGAGAAALGLLGFKFGWLNWGMAEFLVRTAPQPLELIGGAFGLAAIVFALLAKPRGGVGTALVAIAIAAVTYAGIAAQNAYDGRFAPIHDVSTSWTDPVAPSAVLASARGKDALPVETAPRVAAGAAPIYAGLNVAEVNARTCPAAVPVTLTTTPDKAYPLALKAVKDRGLQLVTDDPAHGVIEATSTNFWNMKEDVMVRVRAEGAGSRIDIRSISRQGANDRGHNCRRVTQLRAALTPGA